jgi:hypothetical protein
VPVPRLAAGPRSGKESPAVTSGAFCLFGHVSRLRRPSRKAVSVLSDTTHRHVVQEKLTPHTAAQLKLFALRCCGFAERVAAHQIAFLDAVDIAYDAAIAAGLADAVGDDIVQEVMVGAFFAVGRRPS